jgi:UDP-galactopyranose mutase
MLHSVDVLVVGAGLYGAVFAEQAKGRGKNVLVLDRRAHIAGNAFTHLVDGVMVHQYGAHIFHTSNRDVWDYMNRFSRFNNYINSPIANYKGKIFNLPFNMNTFYAMWGVSLPEDAAKIIDSQRESGGNNLEEKAISLVGRDIYEYLIKGYTEKQWGRACKDLPPHIIERLPIRYTYNNNYFNDTYQGIPVEGYTALVEKLLDGCEIMLDTDYLQDKKHFDSVAKLVVFSGAIDEYYGYKYGELAYRGLRFETQTMDIPNFQGNAVVNYTDADTPYTRIIEHKHFVFGSQPNTVITHEYPCKWSQGDEPFYPVCDERNMDIYSRYKSMAAKEPNVCFGGRLGTYRYLDMHHVVADALRDAHKYL